MTLVIPELATAFMLTFAGRHAGDAIARNRRADDPAAAFALLLTVVLFPLTRTLLPASPNAQAVLPLLAGELAVGFVLGLATRMVIAALQTAGNIVAQQLGLAFAMTVDPSMGGQQAAVGNFLTLLGLTLIFSFDLHHLALMAIRDSYAYLPPAGMPGTGDAAMLAVKAVGKGFALAVQLAAPFIAFGILFNLGLGVLSRLMPQLQVFFLAMPAAILIGMTVLLAVIGVMMGVFVSGLGDFLREFVGR